ncbi:S1C family serine protease [Akkermansia sp.]|uniref:S1C family serine protease n=1 Tax=Akkermansia sp. TaxID=1872421 RepID=UPI0039949B3C
MKKTLRRFCLSTVLCGTVLLAAMQQGVAQSASASSRILRTTPQSVEDLQRIEHQLQAVLPKVLSALVCIQVNNSSGTGILVSEKGLIFSAAHVVGKKDTVLKIILPDGTRIPGKTTAENSDSDAGIAEISELNKNLPIVEKAENRPQVGDWVFALGHGGGLDRKRGPMVRLGRIVSLKNDVIQTDCKLIRGDSGGPLFNLNGELIGIHSRVGSGLEDNLHVPMKEFDALTVPPEEDKAASPGRNG